MQEKTPPIVEDLLGKTIVHHSSVAVQELMHVVGAVDPDDRRSRRVVDAVERIVDAMPEHRLFTPDIDVLAGAAVYAGMLCRTQGYAKDDKLRALHDCVLFLQAMKLGATVLTRNVREFDCLLQIQSKGRVLFYRTEPPVD